MREIECENMIRIALFLTVIRLLVSCGNSTVPKIPEQSSASSDSLPAVAKTTKDSVSADNGRRIYKGDTLVPVDFFNPDILWELKYATKDNFMGKVLYDTMQVLYVQQSVARKLAKCQEYLAQHKPGYHLLVYDGLRPLSVQWEMWNALDTLPVSDRVKFVSNPKNGSVHNYGAALDITICDTKRNVLDMGAHYDDLRKIAYPSLEAQFLASGELSHAQVNNRKMLRASLSSQGFRNIPTEWWHFNEYSRAIVKQRYQLVTQEIR